MSPPSLSQKARITKEAFNEKISLRNQDGQSMAEFALVLPILAFLLFAVISSGSRSTTTSR